MWDLIHLLCIAVDQLLAQKDQINRQMNERLLKNKKQTQNQSLWRFHLIYCIISKVERVWFYTDWQRKTLWSSKAVSGAAKSLYLLRSYFWRRISTFTGPKSVAWPDLSDVLEMWIIQLRYSGITHVLLQHCNSNKMSWSRTGFNISESVKVKTDIAKSSINLQQRCVLQIVLVGWWSVFDLCH